MSFLYFGEGLNLATEEGIYEYPDGTDSLWNGYISLSDEDPGRPVIFLESGNEVKVEANCSKIRPLSFSAAVVVPLPPVIPLFISTEGTVSDEVRLTVTSTPGGTYQVRELNVAGTSYAPIEKEDGTYHFGVPCKAVKDPSYARITYSRGEKIVALTYKRRFIFGWAWIS